MQGGEANGGGSDAVVGDAGKSDAYPSADGASASSPGTEIEQAVTPHTSCAGAQGVLTTYVLEPTSVSMEYAISRHGPALGDEQPQARAATASAEHALPAADISESLISLSVMASDVEGNRNMSVAFPCFAVPCLALPGAKL